MDRIMIARSEEDVIDLSIDDDDEDTYVISGECDGIAVISLDDSDEVSEWDATIRKTFLHISDNLNDDYLLNHFMDTYLKDLKDISACYEDSEDLRRMVQNHIESLYSFFLQIECRHEGKYLDFMEEILAEYMKLELNVIRRVIKINKKTIITTSQRIVRMLSVVLLNQNSHMLHVLIKQSDNYNASASCSEVLSLIYRHYLIDQPPQDKTDEAFCRRYIVFQKWKYFQRDSAWIEMDRLVYRQCNRRPESIETNDVLRPILMPTGESAVDIVRFCYDGLYQIATRYFKYLSGKKEQVGDTEFEVDLSNFMFQDDEISVMNENDSEDVELSKACESFLNGLSLAGKASTSSTDYDRIRRCKEESSEMEEEEVSGSLLLDKDVFSLADLNVSLPNVGSAEKEIAEKTHPATTVSKETHPKATVPEETTHPEPTVSMKIRPESMVSEDTHPVSIVSEDTHPKVTVFAEIHSHTTVSEETYSEATVSEETHSEATVSEETHSEVTISEKTDSEATVSEETHSEATVSVETHPEATVTVETHSEATVSGETHLGATVSVASVEEIAKASVVSSKDSVPIEIEETPAANTITLYENEQSLDSTNVEVMDMELCSEEVVEQCRSPDCPELTPEVPISVACPNIIPEVMNNYNRTLKPPTLVSSVKKYSYNYGQITPPSDVSSDDHNGDKVVVYPKPVQLPSKPEFRASQVNGVRHRTETKTHECNTTLSKHKHIPTEVLPLRVSPVQSHSVINSVKKRNQDHRTKKVRGRSTSDLAIAPAAAAKVATENVIDNFSVEVNKTIDTGQIRVVPVNTIQSACNSSVNITRNSFPLEGFEQRFEQLHNEIMNGPVSKATPVKPALTADFERDIFSSKVTLVQRPLQAPPPISYDESSSRSNSPSDSPSPAYEVIEKDDCKDHFAHSFKDANGANGSRALVQRVTRPRTPKSILKKESRAASRKKKRTDHIKFNEYAKISFYNAMEDSNGHHSKYLQQVLREEAVVLPGDVRPTLMEDPKLNETPKVMLKTNIKRKINDHFLKTASGSGTIRVDFDKSDGSAKLNEKDSVYKSSTPAAGEEIDKIFGFRLTQSGTVTSAASVNPTSVPAPSVYRKSIPEPQVCRKSVPEPQVFHKSVPEPPVFHKSVPKPPVSRKSATKRPVCHKSVPKPPVYRKSVPEHPVCRTSVPEPPASPESVPELPVHHKSVTEPSAYHKPVTKPSVQHKSVTKPSVQHKSVTEPPVHHKSVTVSSNHDKSVAEPPVYHKSITAPSVYNKSVTEPSVHHKSVTEPSVHQKSVTEPSVHQKSVTEPPVYPKSVSEPSAYHKSVTEPPVHNKSVSAPPVHHKSVTEPSVHQKSVTEPPVYPKSVSEPSAYHKSVTEPPVHNKSVSAPPVHHKSVTEPSVHQKSVTEPPVYPKSVTEPSAHHKSVTEQSAHHKSVTAPPVQHKSATEPSVHNKSVTERSVHNQSVTEPSVHKKSVTVPSVHQQSVTEPPIYHKSATAPPIHHTSVIEPPLYHKSITEPLVHPKSVTEPSVHHKSVTAPHVHHKSVTEQSVHNKSVTEPAVYRKSGTTPPIHHTSVIEPPVYPKSEPSEYHKSVTVSPVHQHSVTEPPVYHKSGTAPPIHHTSVLELPVHNKSVTEPAVYRKSGTTPPIHHTSVIEPPVYPKSEPSEYHKSVTVSPVHQHSVTEPPVYHKSGTAPPIHQTSVLELPVHNKSVTEPAVYRKSGTTPPIHHTSVIEPPVYPKSEPSEYHKSVTVPPVYQHSVTEPLVYHKSGTAPPIHHTSVMELPVHHKSVTEPSVHHKSITTPLVYHKSVVGPSVYHKSVIEPSVYHPVTEQSVHHESVTVPPVYHKSGTATPVHHTSVTESPGYNQSVNAPPVYHQTVNAPSIYHQSVAEPSAYHKSVNERPVYHKSVTEPTVYHKSVSKRPKYHKSVTEPPVYHKSVTKSPVYHKSVTEPPVYHNSEPPELEFSNSPKFFSEEARNYLMRETLNGLKSDQQYSSFLSNSSNFYDQKFDYSKIKPSLNIDAVQSLPPNSMNVDCSLTQSLRVDEPLTVDRLSLDQILESPLNLQQQASETIPMPAPVPDVYEYMKRSLEDKDCNSARLPLKKRKVSANGVPVPLQSPEDYAANETIEEAKTTGFPPTPLLMSIADVLSDNYLPNRPFKTAAEKKEMPVCYGKRKSAEMFYENPAELPPTLIEQQQQAQMLLLSVQSSYDSINSSIIPSMNLSLDPHYAQASNLVPHPMHFHLHPSQSYVASGYHNPVVLHQHSGLQHMEQQRYTMEGVHTRRRSKHHQ